MFFQLAFITLILSTSRAGRPRPLAVIESSCLDVQPPPLPFVGVGCGAPGFVNRKKFGDNANSKGVLKIMQGSNGLNFNIVLRDLSKPDLVLTAWLVWVPPGDPNNPAIFDFASIASPLTSSKARFSSGLNREPNQFRYINSKTARLYVRLNFNPTHANEGPLTKSNFCVQKDIPGIQATNLRQGPVPGSGLFTPVSSSYLRRYDRRTGFEKLDKNGNPVLVRSPVGAFAVAIAGHIDRTTHGVAQGNFGVDHFEVMVFRLPQSPIGKATK